MGPDSLCDLWLRLRCHTDVGDLASYEPAPADHTPASTLAAFATAALADGQQLGEPLLADAVAAARTWPNASHLYEALLRLPRPAAKGPLEGALVRAWGSRTTADPHAVLRLALLLPPQPLASEGDAAPTLFDCVPRLPSLAAALQDADPQAGEAAFQFTVGLGRSGALSGLASAVAAWGDEQVLRALRPQWEAVLAAGDINVWGAVDEAVVAGAAALCYALRPLPVLAGVHHLWAAMDRCDAGVRAAFTMSFDLDPALRWQLVTETVGQPSRGPHASVSRLLDTPPPAVALMGSAAGGCALLEHIRAAPDAHAALETSALLQDRRGFGCAARLLSSAVSAPGEWALLASASALALLASDAEAAVHYEPLLSDAGFWRAAAGQSLITPGAPSLIDLLAPLPPASAVWGAMWAVVPHMAPAPAFACAEAAFNKGHAVPAAVADALFDKAYRAARRDKAWLSRPAHAATLGAAVDNFEQRYAELPDAVVAALVELALAPWTPFTLALDVAAVATAALSLPATAEAFTKALTPETRRRLRDLAVGGLEHAALPVLVVLQPLLSMDAVDADADAVAALKALALAPDADPQERGAALQCTLFVLTAGAPVAAADALQQLPVVTLIGGGDEVVDDSDVLGIDPTAAMVALQHLADVAVYTLHMVRRGAFEPSVLSQVLSTTTTAAVEAVMAKLVRAVPSLLEALYGEPVPPRTLTRLWLGQSFAHRVTSPHLSHFLSLLHCIWSLTEALEAVALCNGPDVRSTFGRCAVAVLSVFPAVLAAPALQASPLARVMMYRLAPAGARLVAALRGVDRMASLASAAPGVEDAVTALLHLAAGAGTDGGGLFLSIVSPLAAGRVPHDPVPVVEGALAHPCWTTELSGAVLVATSGQRRVKDDMLGVVCARAMQELRALSAAEAAVCWEHVENIAGIAVNCICLGADVGGGRVWAELSRLLDFADPKGMPSARQAAGGIQRQPWHAVWIATLRVVSAALDAAAARNAADVVSAVAVAADRCERLQLVLAQPLRFVNATGLAAWDLEEACAVAGVLHTLLLCGHRAVRDVGGAKAGFLATQQHRLDGIRNALSSCRAEPPCAPTAHHRFLQLRLSYVSIMLWLSPAVPDLVSARRIPADKRDVTFGALLDLVLSCLRVLQRCHDIPDDAPPSPRSVATDRCDSVIGGTAADSTLGRSPAAVVTQCIELAVLLFCQQLAARQQGRLLPAEQEEIHNVAGQLRQVLRRSRASADKLQDFVDVALRCLEAA